MPYFRETECAVCGKAIKQDSELGESSTLFWIGGPRKSYNDYCTSCAQNREDERKVAARLRPPSQDPQRQLESATDAQAA